MPRRVVVVGLGAVTPIGLDVPSTWEALLAGRSGVDRITAVDAEIYPCKVAAEVKGYDPLATIEPKAAKRMARFTQFAVTASIEALADAGLDPAVMDRNRCGVIIGSGMGDILLIEEVSRKFIERGPKAVGPFFVPMVIADMAAGQVSIYHELKGPNFCTTSACASGSHAIGEALLHIRNGNADVIIAGGSEAAIGNLGFGGFCSAKAVTTRDCPPAEASRPFDRLRDGFVMGEGCGLVVLEELEHARARGARIYCELAGFGSTADGFHITAPAPEGEGAQRALRMALDDAGLAPTEINYINAHGTSTELNDKYESAALRAVFASHADSIAVNSSKSMLGHGLGAAGGMEAAVVAKSFQTGMIHQTINLTEPDPECDLDYVAEGPRRLEITAALSNSFGFGGHNAVLAFRRYS